MMGELFHGNKAVYEKQNEDKLMKQIKNEGLNWKRHQY